MKKENALLIIDAQHDFCDPKGNLSVPGADKDMERLSKWIRDNKREIDNISLTLDSHQPNDVSHPTWWQDKNGKNPAPFTMITSKMAEDGTWTPRFWPERTIEYLKYLENEGEYPHVIWPMHCIIGTPGQALYTPIIEALLEWTYLGHAYRTVAKGTYPLTEHFGAFAAQMPIVGVKETQLNQELIDTLETYERVFFVGEAKSHCVASTLKQAMKYAPNLAKKFVILEDCMSDVPGLGHLGDPIYEEARKRGIRFAKTTEVSLGAVSV